MSIASIAWLSPSASARQVLDSTKTRVNLVDRPQRIVTLAPSLGELAADLVGANIDRIVGVSEYSDYPPGIKKISSVGPYNRFNVEKVLSLKPDLVLATLDGNSKDQIVQLREFGVPVVAVATEHFSEIEASIRLVASALGAASKGEVMATQLRTGIERFRQRGKARSKIGVLLQIGGDPMVVVGGKSFLNDALEVVGASNVYQDSDAHYPRPSLEDILRRDPEVIVIVALGEDPKAFQGMAKKWQSFPGLRAVKNKRVHLLRSDPLLRPTVRLLEGLASLEKTLYGKN